MLKTLSKVCLFLAALCGLGQLHAQTSTVELAQVPMSAAKIAQNLVLLTMSRDHQLFYPAYNDATDVDGDGVIDRAFKPGFTYYGNFVPDRCYQYTKYESGTLTPLRTFKPVSLFDGAKGCGGDKWSGNWLNWVSATRMDVIRRVLYGGMRSDDYGKSFFSVNPPVLAGAFIPIDTHAGGHEWRKDDPDISLYTPLKNPISGSHRHLFNVATRVLSTSSYSYVPPSIRIMENVETLSGDFAGIWNWTASNSQVTINHGDKSKTTAFDGTNKDLYLYVEACVSINGVREENCVGYPKNSNSPTSWRPTGLLHDLATTNTAKFGLLTGSYENNFSGGVLRSNVRDFNLEVDPSTGDFIDTVDGPSIAKTIDKLNISGWVAGTQAIDGEVPWSYRECGNSSSEFVFGHPTQGMCKNWGAPIAEMMYEGLRYFSGKGTPTPSFANSVGDKSTWGTHPYTYPALQLKPVPWQNPFQSPKQASTGATYGNDLVCARPVQMVIADPEVSFDSDQVPGAYFGVGTGRGAALGVNDLIGLNVGTEVNAIWNDQKLGGRKVFIGQAGKSADGMPTPKLTGGFSELRGLPYTGAQDEGSYYAAGVARFAKATGIPVGNPSGDPKVPAVNAKVDTIVLSTGSRIPKLEFKATGGSVIGVIPVSKAVYKAGMKSSDYSETGKIVNMVLDKYERNADNSLKSVSAIVSFAFYSFTDKGTSSAQVRYDISMDTTKLTVKTKQLMNPPVNSTESSVFSDQSNTGFVIYGTNDATKDGLYLETRSCRTGNVCSYTQNADAKTFVLYLDTLPGQLPYVMDPKTPNAIRNTKLLPYNQPNEVDSTKVLPTSRDFEITSIKNNSGFIPQDVLWYTALYGGPDADNIDFKSSTNKNPRNFFGIAGTPNLIPQITKAFDPKSGAASVAYAKVATLEANGTKSAAIYRAVMDTITWSSRLYAFAVGSNGVASNTPLWEASAKIADSRKDGTTLFMGVANSVANVAARPVALKVGDYAARVKDDPKVADDFGNADTFNYVLGTTTKEARNLPANSTGAFRNRGTNAPDVAGKALGSVLGDIVNADPQLIAKRDDGYGTWNGYDAFVAGITGEKLAVGANDGFFHIFDADPSAAGGKELFAYMPYAVRANIKDLASTSYQHRFYVDGPIGVGHAYIKTPAINAPAWRSIAIGTGGAGAKTVFAIDTTSNTFSEKSVLWELNLDTLFAVKSPAFAYARFGNVMGRPAIGRLQDGTWVAIFGNGYNSLRGESSLYVVELATGTLIKMIETNVYRSGLGAIELVNDTDAAGAPYVKHVYGADYTGNIWRFDLASLTKTGGSATAHKVFSTETGQPITAEIKVTRLNGSPNGKTGHMVSFGTGSFLNKADFDNVTDTQSLYGIFDDLSSTTVTRANLADMSLTMKAATDDTRTSSTATKPWYETSDKRGWVLPLSGANVTKGERVIAPPVRYTAKRRVDAFLFTSMTPGLADSCNVNTDIWVTAVDVLSGGFAAAFEGQPGFNSIKINNGAPRGISTLKLGRRAFLFTQTTVNANSGNETYTNTSGGNASVDVQNSDGTKQTGETKVKGKELVTGLTATARTVWRQLK